MHDETDGGRQQCGDHQDTEPTNIQTVVCGRDPGTEVVPGKRALLTRKVFERHFEKGLSKSAGNTEYSIPTLPSRVGMRDVI